MNGTANVDSDKRLRVERAIRETGFEPNKLARALFKKSSGLIGLIVPNIENPFFNEMARVIEERPSKEDCISSSAALETTQTKSRQTSACSAR